MIAQQRWCFYVSSSDDELFVFAAGAFNFTRTNHTLVCLPDPFQEESGENKLWL